MIPGVIFSAALAQNLPFWLEFCPHNILHLSVPITSVLLCTHIVLPLTVLQVPFPPPLQVFSGTLLRLLVLQVSVWDAGWSLKTNEGRKRFNHLSGTLLHLLVLQVPVAHALRRPSSCGGHWGFRVSSKHFFKRPMSATP